MRVIIALHFCQLRHVEDQALNLQQPARCYEKSIPITPPGYCFCCERCFPVRKKSQHTEANTDGAYSTTTQSGTGASAAFAHSRARRIAIFARERPRTPNQDARQ